MKCLALRAFSSEGEVREVESGWSHGRGGGVAIGKIGLNRVYRVTEFTESKREWREWRLWIGIGKDSLTGRGREDWSWFELNSSS